MNQEDSIRLIELYKAHTFLWDPKEKAHHNRAKREEAWNEISAMLEQPVPILKLKMKTLMGSYRSERSRENKKRMKRSGNQELYESKWFAYKYFDFLKDRDNPNTTTVDTDRKDAIEFLEVVTEGTSDTPLDITADPLQDTKLFIPTIKEPRKRKKVENKSDSNKMTGQVLEILQSSASASNDPYFTYALNLANELRKYDAPILAHVKRAIANILFDADMGRMPSYPSTSNDNNTYSY